MDSPAASVALVCFVKLSLLPLHLQLAVTNVQLLLATVSFCFEQQSLTLTPQTLDPTGGEGGGEGEERVRRRGERRGRRRGRGVYLQFLYLSLIILIISVS